MSQLISVFLADDHAVVRDSLGFLLEAQPDMRVVGYAADGRDAVHRARQLYPDIVILDIAMPELNGIEATEHIRTQGMPFYKGHYPLHVLYRRAYLSGTAGRGSWLSS